MDLCDCSMQLAKRTKMIKIKYMAYYGASIASHFKAGSGTKPSAFDARLKRPQSAQQRTSCNKAPASCELCSLPRYVFINISKVKPEDELYRGCSIKLRIRAAFSLMYDRYFGKTSPMHVRIYVSGALCDDKLAILPTRFRY